MLTDFFYTLRAAKLPVSVREYLTLLEALRDIIVIVIHAFYIGLMIYLFSWWQKRGETAAKELPVSTYGRPLVRKG